MRAITLQTKELFREVVINENGIEDLYLSELTDIKNMCKVVVELADKQMEKYKNAPVGDIAKWSRETITPATKEGDGE